MASQNKAIVELVVDGNPSPTTAVNVFDEAQKEVLVLIQRDWPKFTESPHFDRFVEERGKRGTDEIFGMK